MTFDDYNFNRNTQEMYDVLFTKNIYTLVYRNKRFQEVMNVKKAIPDIIMMPSTPSDYDKFITGHILDFYGPLYHINGIYNNLYICMRVTRKLWSYYHE